MAKAHKMGMDRERLAKLVKKVWNVLEESGICDSYGGAEYERCENLVADFIATIYFSCNVPPSQLYLGDKDEKDKQS